MAGRFDRQVQTALRLIKKNGQLVAWHSRKKSIDDDFKEVIAESVENVWVCFLPYDNSMKAFIRYLMNKEVKTGSVYGLMGQVSFDPDSTDFVVRDGVRLDISSIELLSPNGQKILYTVEFKG